MKRIKAVEGLPDLTDWDLASIEIIQERLEEIIKAAAAEAVGLAMADEQTSADFPAIWGPRSDEPARADPLTIYLTIAVGGGGMRDEHPVWSFSLRDILASELDECRNDGSFAEGLTAIRDALRTFADEIDAAVRQGGEK